MTSGKLVHGLLPDRPLRSLSGLVDFELAARVGSFKLAAEALHKTPAAVSQQIRQLEAGLGFALFARHPRKVVLTAKGREFAQTVAAALDELRTKAASLREDAGEAHVLRITTTHSFALKCLAPRLGEFTRLCPDLDLRLESGDRPEDLAEAGIDVAIRYARIKAGDPDVLLRENLLAVYSPALAGAPRRPLRVADLRRHPLLYEGTTAEWLRLLAAHDVERAGHDFARGFSHSGILAQAAVAGQGIALVGSAIVHEDLRLGTLRCVRAQPLASRFGYRFIAHPARAQADKVLRFRAWIEREMRALRGAPAAAQPP